jgi:hypothetical protein
MTESSHGSNGNIFMKPISGAALLLAVSLNACSLFTPSASVNRILAEPQRYADDDVWVNGRVTQSASVLGRGAYQIDDGTGTLWVISYKGVPRKDARVRVRGTVRDAFGLGDVIELPEGMRNGLVLVEQEHRATDMPPPTEHTPPVQ